MFRVPKRGGATIRRGAIIRGGATITEGATTGGNMVSHFGN